MPGSSAKAGAPGGDKGMALEALKKKWGAERYERAMLHLTAGASLPEAGAGRRGRGPLFGYGSTPGGPSHPDPWIVHAQGKEAASTPAAARAYHARGWSTYGYRHFYGESRASGSAADHAVENMPLRLTAPPPSEPEAAAVAARGLKRSRDDDDARRGDDDGDGGEKDHWVACSRCDRWRLVTRPIARKYRGNTAPFFCEMLQGANCKTPCDSKKRKRTGSAQGRTATRGDERGRRPSP